MITTLYYVHDPMCSWCWAFRPVWEQVRARLPQDLPVEYLLGGLAPDSAEPMAEEMRQGLQQTWQKIQRVVPGTEFNFDFWTKNTPRRSTYPACRAVIAAKNQNPEYEKPMILAIQQAYYLRAINPSDDENLIELAQTLGLDGERFKTDLSSMETRRTLAEQIEKHHRLGAQGFPSLIVDKGSQAHYIASSYTDADATLRNILHYL
ncbi:MAG: DsbA family protein [Gammaproteobacteria bacterium]|nr:DsbA family protein [Gammaproteobacteria bacterium]